MSKVGVEIYVVTSHGLLGERIHYFGPDRDRAWKEFQKDRKFRELHTITKTEFYDDVCYEMERKRAPLGYSG